MINSILVISVLVLIVGINLYIFHAIEEKLNHLEDMIYYLTKQVIKKGDKND